MKTLTTILAISTLLISAGAANAAIFFGGNDQIATQPTTTKQAAFEAGFNKLNSLKTASSDQLSDEFRMASMSIDSDSITLDDGAYVTVQERMNNNGQRVYIGVVNASVSYTDYDHNNDD